MSRSRLGRFKAGTLSNTKNWIVLLSNFFLNNSIPKTVYYRELKGSNDKTGKGLSSVEIDCTIYKVYTESQVVLIDCASGW